MIAQANPVKKAIGVETASLVLDFLKAGKMIQNVAPKMPRRLRKNAANRSVETKVISL